MREAYEGDSSLNWVICHVGSNRDFQGQQGSVPVKYGSTKSVSKILRDIQPQRLTNQSAGLPSMGLRPDGLTVPETVDMTTYVLSLEEFSSAEG